MKPKENDYVIVYFNNQTRNEGRVIQWTDDTSGLILDNDDILVIINTKASVFAVRIVRGELKKEQPPLQELLKSAAEPVSTNEHFDKESFRVARLAELYKKKAEMERENFRKHLTTFTPTETKPFDYAKQPTRLQPVPQYPKKKIR